MVRLPDRGPARVGANRGPSVRIRRVRLLPALVLAAMIAGSGCGPRADSGPDHTDGPPLSIVLIYVDDLGWRDLGVQGSGFYETPRIDDLAARGMRFTNAYANAPNCAPSRASLMTGLYPPRHGIYSVATNARGRAEDRRLKPAPDRTELDTTFVTLAEYLRQAGYSTGFFGKWHLGGEGAFPEDQGFDVSVGGDEAGSPASYFAPYRGRNRGIRDLEGTGAPGEYLTDRLTDEAVSFIQARAGEPLFLMLSHYGVHTPIRADSARIRRFADKAPDGGHQDATYAAMIAAVDESVGRVLDTLEELGLTDRTLVVFASDNGGYGPITDMRPLRGAKGMLYEGGIRVPLIVRWPGVVRPSTESDVPVIGTDFLPTFLAAAGASPPERGLDGRDLRPILDGSGVDGAGFEDRPIFWHFPAYLEAYSGSNATWRTTPASAIRRGRWKLIHFFEGETTELYDLESDPGELHDLADRHPDMTRGLLGQLRSWQETTGAFIPDESEPAFRSATGGSP